MGYLSFPCYWVAWSCETKTVLPRNFALHDFGVKEIFIGYGVGENDHRYENNARPAASYP